jgi:Zn-dependent peptidase ImmA (M78 family)/DNA-binding XRE family transcriptional regulator
MSPRPALREVAVLSEEGRELRERIKRLRLLRRWDQSELGERAGISATTVSQIETGRVAATSPQIESIASALGYSTSFLSASRGLIPTGRPWLRAYADASRREAEARTAAVTTALEYVRSIGLQPLQDRIPYFDDDPEADFAIEDAAAELRALAELDEDAVVGNAIRAAERLGCIVLPFESELGRHLGMSVRCDGVPVICVAKTKVPGDRQRFTVAHELGHLMLHGSTPPPGDASEATRLERQANRFAAAFLSPGDALLETLDENGGRVTLRTLGEIKAVWGVAIKSLVGRLQTLGRIDPDQARSLYKQISARGWSKSEPVDVRTESAVWFDKSLTRRAAVDVLSEASATLAAQVGGNANDLFHFADWSSPREAEIFDFARGRSSTVSR